MEAAEPQHPGGSRRGRLLLAAGLAAVLLLGFLAVLLRGGEDEPAFEQADAGCVAAWNEDPRAVSLGRHQLVGHGYFYVEVTALSADGATELPAGDSAGACTMVFAASTFARERSSVAMIHEPPAGWLSLNRRLDPDRLAALQDEAQSTYNAHLDEDGTIAAL